jgi:hypothetical protein
MAKLRAVLHRKSDLDNIPKQERTFYLMAGQLANDINILGKLLIFATTASKEPGEPRQWAGMTTAVLILEILAGRLYEGYRLIDKAFSARKLRAKYTDDLNPGAMAKLDTLNRYFSSDNAIKRVRHKFASHFGVEEIEATYAGLSHDFAFIDLVSDEYRGHTLFYGAEQLSFQTLAEVVGGEPGRAFDKLIKETLEMQADMGVFLGYFIEAIWRRHLNFTEANVKKVEVQSDGPIDTYSLPFFCDPPKSWNRG